MAWMEFASFTRGALFFTRGFLSRPIAVECYHPEPYEQPVSQYNQVGPGYLATAGIPLVRGREFTRADDDTVQPVAVINEVLAARYFGGQDPIGQRLVVKGKPLRIVGGARAAT